MTKVVMYERRMEIMKSIETTRPLVGEQIRDAGYLFYVQQVVLRSGSDTVDITVVSEPSFSKTEALYDLGWSEINNEGGNE